ncbi:hypothetical protein VNO80_25167 [Phaseolus coccineus]|uniref:Uncharacterized protein n=1 Tax=Phaseolus coccineus TaxID=3886 RepID=A0AAN9LY28_PHACN
MEEEEKKRKRREGFDGFEVMRRTKRACTFEVELALLLRISHKYGKSGAQVLFSMGILDNLSSGRAMNLQGSLRWVETRLRRDVAVDVDRQRMIITPIMRLVFSLTSLVDTSNFLEPSDASSSYPTSVELQQPTLCLLNFLLSSVTNALERTAEEKSILLNKIQDINELSRQEVDEIINMCVRQDIVSSSDNIQKYDNEEVPNFIHPHNCHEDMLEENPVK